FTGGDGGPLRAELLRICPRLRAGLIHLPGRDAEASSPRFDVGSWKWGHGFSFRLPTTDYRLPTSDSFQRFDSRKLPLGQELERGAAPRGDVRELPGDAGLVRGLDALAAADDRDHLAAGDQPRDRHRPPVERRLLEHAHRTVPEDRLR